MDMNHPTAADWANATANDAKNELTQLRRELAALKSRVAYLESKVLGKP